MCDGSNKRACRTYANTASKCLLRESFPRAGHHLSDIACNMFAKGSHVQCRRQGLVTMKLRSQLEYTVALCHPLPGHVTSGILTRDETFQDLIGSSNLKIISKKFYSLTTLQESAVPSITPNPFKLHYDIIFGLKRWSVPTPLHGPRHPKVVPSSLPSP